MENYKRKNRTTKADNETLLLEQIKHLNTLIEKLESKPSIDGNGKQGLKVKIGKLQFTKKEISKMQDTINEYMIKITDSENHKNDVVIEYTANKTSVLQRMANYMFKSKSRRTFLKLVVNQELTPEQVTQIRYGLEKGLTEEQLALIINKSLSPERIKSIVEFAALENELNSERRG